MWDYMKSLLMQYSRDPQTYKFVAAVEICDNSPAGSTTAMTTPTPTRQDNHQPGTGKKVDLQAVPPLSAIIIIIIIIIMITITIIIIIIMITIIIIMIIIIIIIIIIILDNFCIILLHKK